ncbi:helicase [Tanacetum coccineum]|uniref:ATP-dependent DNA helicase n=1 Tax=Tanacetum coccineum TaxID=301880 RepID=A0ABQ5I6Z5_9ASTR
MTKEPWDKTADNQSLANILHKSLFIPSNTIIQCYGKVQSFCGLKIAHIGATCAAIKANTRAAIKQNIAASTSRQPARRSEFRMQGKVRLSKFHDAPPPLNRLLDYTDPTTLKFRDKIRVYNSMFYFTSFGARIDHSINTDSAPYTFRINGQNYHRIGSLLPKEGIQPRYVQLYFFDTENEVQNRMSAFTDKETLKGVDTSIVQRLIEMLNQSSSVANEFWMAKIWSHSYGPINVQLKLLGERTKAMQYNKPTVAEVAAFITNDFGDGVPTRDIIVDKKDCGPKRISKLHPSYMALQYPLLFPYGEDGFHEKIPYHTNEGSQKINRGFVTMKEFYAYIIQQRNDQDLYHNVCDTVKRGDTNAEGLGKRIVLAGTFTGGPRYMMSNYQDAMALCRTYGNPDLFITFTSNPKWPEISEILSYLPGQKPHDRPEVGTRVFKLKLTQLLEELIKNKVFGDCLGVIYIIEFQKRGLPHVHILLWLEEHYKCNTPAQIDDIISAEILSQLEDPEGYKVVTEFMLHGPCGKDAKHALCNIEEKCSKHFPKSFNEETITDADGYSIYHRRDNKSFATKGKFKTGKTFLYKTIMARLRLERMIVLAVASSGIASLLFPGEDEATWIEIPERFLIKEWTNPIEQIVQETYPDFTTRQHDNDYLKERAILTPRNDDSDKINAYMFKKIAGDTVTYTSADEICKVLTDTLEQHNLYPVEFLNSLNFPGMPPHSLCLKKELTIMLIQKVNPSKGLCNGTRLIITDLVQFVIWAKILTGSHVGGNVLIHRIILTSTQSKWPFVLNRRQFPIGPCYAMTINKSQGQSLNHVVLYLPNPVFSHGQLYVALFKVTDPEGLKILMILDQNKELHNHTRNIVFKETFNNLT